MQTLIEAGIQDLGGEGDLLLEIEYNSDGQFKEAFYRLPEECNHRDIEQANILHCDKHTTLGLTFSQMQAFTIHLTDRCDELVEVRLPGAAGGANITHIFFE
jgi:hypothetical protein